MSVFGRALSAMLAKYDMLPHSATSYYSGTESGGESSDDSSGKSSDKSSGESSDGDDGERDSESSGSDDEEEEEEEGQQQGLKRRLFKLSTKDWTTQHKPVLDRFIAVKRLSTLFKGKSVKIGRLAVQLSRVPDGFFHRWEELQQEGDELSEKAFVEYWLQPAAKWPAAKWPAAKWPAAKWPAAKRPAAEQPAAEQPAAEQPAAEQPAAKEISHQQASRGGELTRCRGWVSR